MEIKMVTQNRNKLREIEKLLKPYGFRVVGVYVPTDEIQSNSLKEIVLRKAESIINMVKPIYLVEDSGLFINALNQFPGPYSNFIFETIGNKGILKLMRNVKDRTAIFRTVIAAVILPNVIKLFEGEVKGSISKEIRGEKGFGFDPIFIPDGWDKTLGEIGVEEKNIISHRGNAFRKFAEYMSSYMKIAEE
jgi:XTP/dITP diphosphohydrolase